jgi:hypothetical protein
MKLNILHAFLMYYGSLLLGQTLLSSDIDLYLKNETRYKKKASKVIKHNLNENNKSLMIKDLDFLVIPTFLAKERYLESNHLDSFLLTLKIDKDIILEQILMFEQKNYLAGFYFCESNSCDVNLYTDSPQKFKKIEMGVNRFIVEEYYDLIFRVKNFPHFWFLYKDSQLSLYSFLNDTLYQEENELQLYIRNYIKKK